MVSVGLAKEVLRVRRHCNLAIWTTRLGYGTGNPMPGVISNTGTTTRGGIPFESLENTSYGGNSYYMSTPVQATAITNPAEARLFADSSWVNLSSVYEDTDAGDPNVFSANAAAIAQRHSGRLNVCFVDGHVTPVKYP